MALRGGLGVGKTVFTKGIGRALGVTEEITSPTYTIISEYQGKLPLYHIDAYRLGGEEDFNALGPEEFLYSPGICVIEWSEKVETALPRDSIRVELSIIDGTRRRVRVWASPDVEEKL